MKTTFFAPVLVLGLVSSAGPRGCTPAPKVPPKASGEPAAMGTLARPVVTPKAGPVELTFPDETFRGTQPVPGTLKDLAQPGVERFALANGVEVYLVERHELPTVSMQLVMQGGKIDDPKGKEGMTSLCVGLMGDGTEKLDKIAFSEALADLASSVGAGAGLDEQSVTLSALTRNLDPTLDLWADTLLAPGPALRQAHVTSHTHAAGGLLAKMLEMAQRMLRGEIPPAPVMTLVGFRLTAIEPGHATMELDAEPRHANPMGTLHGGILCDLADGAMGVCWAATLGDGETFTTLELKMNFLKPVWTGKLVATARVVKGGKTVGMLECDVVDEKGSLVARASSTVLTLRGTQAAGR